MASFIWALNVYKVFASLREIFLVPVLPDWDDSMQEQPKMSTKDLNFYYGESQALHGISLDFQLKQVTALIGPSGCGKSTLLRCLNRMNDLIPYSRAEGGVFLDGEDIYDPGVDVVALRRHVGMVFQKPNPFPKSIFENVAYGLRVNGVKDKNLSKRQGRDQPQAGRPVG